MVRTSQHLKQNSIPQICRTVGQNVCCCYIIFYDMNCGLSEGQYVFSHIGAYSLGYASFIVMFDMSKISVNRNTHSIPSPTLWKGRIRLADRVGLVSSHDCPPVKSKEGSPGGQAAQTGIRVTHSTACCGVYTNRPPPQREIRQCLTI